MNATRDVLNPVSLYNYTTINRRDVLPSVADTKTERHCSIIGLHLSSSILGEWSKKVGIISFSLDLQPQQHLLHNIRTYTATGGIIISMNHYFGSQRDLPVGLAATREIQRATLRQHGHGRRWTAKSQRILALLTLPSASDPTFESSNFTTIPPGQFPRIDMIPRHTSW